DVALVDETADVVKIELDLWNQDDVRAAGDSGFERDPPGIASHHFDEHHAVVRFRRGMNLVYRVSRGVQRRVEAERDLRGRQIVVDRLGHAHNREALLRQVESDLLGAVAADDDQAIHAHGLGVANDFVREIAGDFLAFVLQLVIEWVATIGGAQDGAAARKDSTDVVQQQGLCLLRPDEAIEAVPDTNDFPTIFEDGGLNGCTDDCVQSRAVAAPCANTDLADIRHEYARMKDCSAMQRTDLRR